MSDKNQNNENDHTSSLTDLDNFFDFSEPTPKLTNKQIDALESYLDARASQNVMHLELLDGFFCALIVGPAPISPDEYLPVIFGGKMPEFKDQAEQDMIMGAINQHWEHIESEIKRGNEYYPFLYADPDGKCGANEWAYGFILGMELRRDEWKEMVEISKEDGLLTPILTLYSEYIPEVTGCEPIPAEEREEIVKTLVANLPSLYEHFAPNREKNKLALH